MMIHSLTLIPNSVDPETIEESLSQQTAAMRGAGGLKGIKMSEGHLMSPGGPPAYSKVVETEWESLEAFMDWVQNQTPADNANKDFMLKNGAILLFYEVKEI